MIRQHEQVSPGAILLSAGCLGLGVRSQNYGASEGLRAVVPGAALPNPPCCYPWTMYYWLVQIGFLFSVCQVVL